MEQNYFDMRITELEKRIDEKFISNEKALNTAKENINYRLEGMNELREQINNERGRFLTNSMFETKHEEHQKQIEEIKKIIGTNSNRITGIETRLLMLGAIALFIGPFIALVIGPIITITINHIFK